MKQTKVVEQFGEISQAVSYNMINGADATKVSDHKGEIVDFKAWILYETEDKDGNPVNALSILDSDDVVMSTISKTFIEQFLDIKQFMGETPYKIKVIGGTSSAGREFVTCSVIDK